ncbi:DNA cytosine methyltransferase [Neobacillus sp.]|uniref:DNA cytosine methyltransferase n=1 Tax=Neobacillus sp. TaxID=2675273 RepID=UPI0035B52B82
MTKKAICLFSSAGIGELGIKQNEIDIIISNEIIQNRHELYKVNYPETKCFTGDIWVEKEKIVNYFKEEYPDEELFLLYATPPCQGMSSNGAGKLLDGVRKGIRPPIDERNRLIIPTLDIITETRPKWILLENVPNMKNTIINDENDNYVNIMDYIQSRLGSEYVGKGEVVSCSDYGIPQVRKRLITIFTRDEEGKKYFKELGTFFPENEKLPQITLRQAIGGLPSLDSRKGYESRKDFHPLHYVPIMKEEKYWWVSNTKEGDTAYNNQCVNEECGFQGNQKHIDVINNGIAQSSKDTPIYCAKCGSLLPRPTIIDKKTGKRRLIRGFHSAYRRMNWDEPASTLTKNFQFEASDNKIHPEQNRVLSIYEALIIQTINDYEYCFEINGKLITRSLFAQIIGESVPPKLIDMICRKIIDISSGQWKSKYLKSKQLSLF